MTNVCLRQCLPLGWSNEIKTITKKKEYIYVYKRKKIECHVKEGRGCTCCLRFFIHRMAYISPEFYFQIHWICNSTQRNEVPNLWIIFWGQTRTMFTDERIVVTQRNEVILNDHQHHHYIHPTNQRSSQIMMCTHVDDTYMSLKRKEAQIWWWWNAKCMYNCNCVNTRFNCMYLQKKEYFGVYFFTLSKLLIIHLIAFYQWILMLMTSRIWLPLLFCFSFILCEFNFFLLYFYYLFTQHFLIILFFSFFFFFAVR